MSIDFDHDKMMNDLENDLTESMSDEATLNLKNLMVDRLADLRKYKSTRAEMVAKRDAIDRAIKVLDKRIEMVLDDVKIMSMPL